MSDAKKTTEVEIWVLVDSIGDYEIGTTAEEADERFESNIGSHQGGRRLVKLKLTVPLPKAMELTATIPDEEHEPAELAVAKS